MIEWMTRLKKAGVVVLAMIVGAFVFWLGQWQWTRYQNEQALRNVIAGEVIPILQFNLQQGTLRLPPQMQPKPAAAPVVRPAPPADVAKPPEK